MEFVQNILFVLGAMVCLYTIGFFLNQAVRRYDDISNPPLVVRVVTAVGSLFYLASFPIAILVLLWSSPTEASVKKEAQKSYDDLSARKDAQIDSLRSELARIRNLAADEAGRQRAEGFSFGYSKGYQDCKKGLPYSPPASRADQRASVPSEPHNDSSNSSFPSTNCSTQRTSSPPSIPSAPRETTFSMSTFDGDTLCIPASRKQHFLDVQQARKKEYFSAHSSARDQLFSCLEASVNDFCNRHFADANVRIRVILAAAIAFSSDTVILRYPIFSSLCDLSVQRLSEGHTAQVDILQQAQSNFLYGLKSRWPMPAHTPRLIRKASPRCERKKWLKTFAKYVLSYTGASWPMGSTGGLIDIFEDFEGSARILLSNVPASHEYL